jgi:phage terminase small subunit
MPRPISDKLRLFVNEYLIDLNAYQAAMRAGYSQKTAKSKSDKILKHPEVQKLLAEKAKKLASKFEITQERTMLEIARIAFQDSRDFFGEDGKLIPIKNLNDDAAAVLAGFDIEEIYDYSDRTKTAVGLVKKIKRFDKNKALEMLAKHFKLYSDAPPDNVTHKFDLSNLTPAELKTLLALKSKLSV